MQPQLLNSRLEKLRGELAKQNLSAILISKQENRFYLTGWSGDSESGYLLISKDKAFVITDSRYTEEVVERVLHFELRQVSFDDTFWKKLFLETKVDKVAFEAEDLSVAKLKKLKRSSKIGFIPTVNIVERLRAVKDQEEINLLKKAISISDQAFEYILKNIKPGQTEKQIAWELEKFMKESGASKNAWESLIVASGSNSSKVHYAAGGRQVKKIDQVLLDWGCVYQGYHSDTSRVIFLGAPTEKQAEVYKLVLEAQQIGINQVKAGGVIKKVDQSAREFLTRNSKFAFGHGVGHGVGLEVHELPSVNFRSKEKFQVGNVVTVEPGIYEPGWGGIRIEDMILVEEGKAKELTTAKKDLKSIIRA